MKFNIEVGYIELVARLETILFKSQQEASLLAASDRNQSTLILKKSRHGYQIYYKQNSSQLPILTSTFVFEFNLTEYDSTSTTVKGFIRPDKFSIFGLVIVTLFLSYLMIINWSESWLYILMFISAIFGYAKRHLFFKRNIKKIFIQTPFY